MGRLAECVFHQARTEGIDSWYVTPSHNSYPIFMKKSNYRETFDLHYACSILNPSGLLAAAGLPPSISRLMGAPLDAMWKLGRRVRRKDCSGYTVEPLSRFGVEADRLWGRVDHSGVCLVRDATYLNWRYFDGPDRYQVFHFHASEEQEGILVLKRTIRRGQPSGDIVDAIWPAGDTETLSAMLSWAIELFAKEHCVMAQAWALTGSPLTTQLHAAGLVFRRARVRFLFSPDSPHEGFYDPTKWILTLGDSNDI